MNREQIEERIGAYPIFEYAFIEPENIRFLPQVRHICETECPQYGKSWSCPPAVGTVEECKERCARYTGGFLFTTIAEDADLSDMEAMLRTRMEHEEITRQVRDIFSGQYKEVLTLSTESCALCEKCAYPDAPCRFPDKCFPCIESYGILVTKLAEEYGLSFMNGANVVTWFSLILFAAKRNFSRQNPGT